MFDTTAFRARLRGVAAALRFSRLPLICAVIVALASTDPRGRALAIILGAAVLIGGFALQAREIFLGRPARR